MSQLETDVTRLGDEFVDRSQRLYDTQLKSRLEPEHIGRFVAIEPETCRYFLGNSGAEALLAARSTIPDGFFYLAKIGSRAAHTIGGHASRIR